MSFAMELSPAGFDEMLGALDCMDRKTGRAFLKLCGYLRRFGSVPSGDNALASILGVTVRYFRERAWPLLEDRLILSDDGRRYYSPEIERAERPASKIVPPDLSEIRRAAAQASHASRRRESANEEPDAAPKPRANGMQNASKTDANGMQTASKTDANGMQTEGPFAAGLHDFASDPSHVPPPSLSSSPFYQPNGESIESKEGSKGEGESARASADADGLQNPANGLQNGMQNPANGLQTDAKLSTKSMPVESGLKQPRQTVLPENWQPTREPSAEALAAIDKAGRDRASVLAEFRAHYLKKGVSMANWDAAFDSWCLKVHRFEPPPQMPLVQTFSGGKPDKPDKAAFLHRETERIARRRVGSGADEQEDGPIIEGEAG
jgi:hypothetical protein